MPNLPLPNAVDPLAAFLPATRAWFENTLGQPTPPQLQGWPAIQRGEHTLILAPTGSGKPFSAFLWGIEQLFHALTPTATEPTRITNHLAQITQIQIQNPPNLHLSTQGAQQRCGTQPARPVSGHSADGVGDGDRIARN